MRCAAAPAVRSVRTAVERSATAEAAVVVRFLSEADLRPLLADDPALDRAVDAVEASILRAHNGEPGKVVYAGLTLANGDELATFFGALPSGPATLRIFPRSSTGPRTSPRLGMLIDGRSGELLSVLSLGGELNAYRTAVPAAVAVRHLAREDATALAVLGSGLQARAHVRSYARTLPRLETIRVWSPTAANRQRFAAALGSDAFARRGTRITAVDTAQEAVSGADVIAAAGRYQAGNPALPDPGFLAPGALFVSMTHSGGNVLSAGGRLVVPTSIRPELVATGFSSGFFRDGPPRIEGAALQLADVIAGRRPARDRPDDILVFELAAPYLWDVPILEWVHRWAAEAGVGSVVPL